MGCGNSKSTTKETLSQVDVAGPRSNNGGLGQYSGDGKQAMLMMPCMQNQSDLRDLMQKATKHEK